MKRGAGLAVGLAAAAALGLLMGGEASAKPAPAPGGAGKGPGPVPGGAALEYGAIGDPRPGARTLALALPHMEGGDVREWQTVMLAFSPQALPEFGADGDFGNETKRATEDFQRAANAFYARVGMSDRLVVDGKAGPLTRTAAARRAHEQDVAAYAPAVMRGDTPIAGVVPVMDPVPTAPPELQLASAVARELFTSRPGTEDKQLVRAFQAAAGLTASGYYNVQTADALARMGIVPPTPFYWGSGSVRAKKRRYRARLEQRAEADPVRAAEWRGAARQVS